MGAFTSHVAERQINPGRQERAREHVMNTEEMNWLLRTIPDSESAKRFVLAQYERGRISLKVMADVAPKTDWMHCMADQVLTTAADHLTQCA